MSAERYVAIRHPFVHDNQITEVRIIIASGLTWAAAIILPTQDLWLKERHLLTILAPSVIIFLVFPVMFYFNVAVYREVRRNEKQIAAKQVSLEEKEKILKNKRVFYTKTAVIFLIFLCFIPTAICLVSSIFFKGIIPVNIRKVVVPCLLIASNEFAI